MGRPDGGETADTGRELRVIGDDHPGIQASHAVRDDMNGRNASCQNLFEPIFQVVRPFAERAGKAHVRLMDVESVRSETIGDAVEVTWPDVDAKMIAEELAQLVEAENPMREDDGLRAHCQTSPCSHSCRGLRGSTTQSGASGSTVTWGRRTGQECDRPRHPFGLRGSTCAPRGWQHSP